MPMCFWLKAFTDKHPNIMSETDDVGRRFLKKFILKMLSYDHKARPTITEVRKFVQNIMDNSEGEPTPESNICYLQAHRFIQNKERFPTEHYYLSTANYDATRSDLKLYLL